MKKKIFLRIIVFALVLCCMIFIIYTFFYPIFIFRKLKEYDSYTTKDGNYTVSLRDSSETGLFGATRLNVYLVDSNGHIKYIGENRLDYYDDFTPYVDFTELNGKVIVAFHLKHSTEKIEVILK